MSWRSREVFMPPRPSFRRYRADRRRRPHLDDLQIGADAGGAAVLEGDHGIDVHPLAAGIHRLDEAAVAYGHDTPPHLAGTCPPPVVGVQFPVVTDEGGSRLSVG